MFSFALNLFYIVFFFFFFFLVKEQVQADIIITSAVQDERLLKILQGQGAFNAFRFISFQVFHSWCRVHCWDGLGGCCLLRC